MKLSVTFFTIFFVQIIAFLYPDYIHAQPSPTPMLIWADRDASKIQVSNRDGSNIETLFQGIESPFRITINTLNNKMYWIENSRGKIRRANLDGSNVEDIVNGMITTANSSWGIALDAAANRLYWTGAFSTPEVKIWRAGLDGSNMEELLFDSTGLPLGLDLDLTNQKIYWTNSTRKIRRANLDGSGQETIFSDPIQNIIDVTVDEGESKIYWTISNGIMRADLDGGNPEVVLSDPPGEPYTLELDLSAGKIYWTDLAGGTNRIKRANMNGSGIEIILEWNPFRRPIDLALDVSEGMMYWADDDNCEINRVNSDSGANEENLFNGIGKPQHIALDHPGNKIYWTDPFVGKIFRATWDGSDREVVHTKIADLKGIAIDEINEKIYFITNVSGQDVIRRMDLNGANVEDFIYDDLIMTLAIDPAGGKIYWATDGIYGIRRADLNGSNIQNLTGSYSNLHGLALDLNAQKLYWSFKTTGQDSVRIMRANLDGSSGEIVIYGENNSIPYGVAVDPADGRIYWTTVTLGTVGKITRAYLDGTGIEEIITGLNHPWGIAIGNSTVAISPQENQITNIFHLEQNYPNPFNPVTTIRYHLPKRSFVTLEIYNITGQRIARLVSNWQSAGSHTILFNGSEFTSGIYFYKLHAEELTQSRKMLMVK